MADTSNSDNTSTPSNAEEPREEMQNHDNFASNLDEELLSVLVNLQNTNPNTQNEIGNPIVKSEGLSVKATVTDEKRPQGLFCSKAFLISPRQCFQRLRFKFCKKGWILQSFRGL